SLMGQAYPQPGLHGKFYDVDMDPLVEVVRDTVGRHDTFALACTAKYYEDMGYPGHVNCTENFNGEVSPFGIAPRKGWEALNFFYNTGFDASMAFTMDEPWSRPCDFVLLRAMHALPGRHRPGERLADHARPRPRLCPGQHLLDGRCPPCDPRRRAGAHE